MKGTEWTEPGQGATVYQLLEAVGRDYHSMQPRQVDRVLVNRIKQLGTDYQTDLRLTGAPLTAEDLKRIAEAR